MTNVDYILSLCGTALGGALGKSLFDWVINKNKNKLEKQLKEQVFYKSLIEDMTTQHEVEKSKIEELESKIDELTKEIHKLVKVNKEKDIIIDQYRDNVKKWENNCTRLESIIKEKDKVISSLSKNEG
jgi:predicted RNase H-like nuclease (RuvC/YqgF family)